jgi:hypothetical protein
VIKSRIMQMNRLVALVAGTMGYHSGMKEKDREASFAEARKRIKEVMGDLTSEIEGGFAHPLQSVIRTTMVGVNAFEEMQESLEKSMRKQVALLPGILAWVGQPEQRGFGEMMLAVIIGETGDLSDYANPGKVWRRLGCAPWEFNGSNHMGSTWRYGKEGKLPAEEWEKFGYSPRRRSIAYLIGEGLVKQNKGVYRRRYDETKKIFKENHPDYSDKRCHLHGMLLATKLLLKNLWIEWNK